MPGLLIEGVSHAYGQVLAVDNVSLAVDRGELVCLLGPSGCGKTTTLRIAAGLEPLQRGRIIIDDEAVSTPQMTLPPEKRRVGLVFQDYALFPHLDILHNVMFGMQGGGAERRTRAEALLARVGLTHHGESFPHMLSGGEQQRVALVRALAPRPGLMLLDEPFSGLDGRLRDQVRDETLALLKETGTATLLVTHDPEEAMRMADRIVLMDRGRVIQQGQPAELYSHPANAFVAEFFSEINTLKGIVKAGQVATPLGGVEARELPEGTRVKVLIRPEGVMVNKSGTRAIVCSARTLGPYGISEVMLDGGQKLVIRTSSRSVLRAGDTVRLRLDGGGSFIFAETEASRQ